MSNGREMPTLSQLNTAVSRDKDVSDTLSPDYDSKGSASGREGGNFPMYIAINEYFKRMEDELDMKPGDKIKVITDDEEYKDGWYFGRNLRTNEEGLYPVVFTQKITVEKAPPLMRAKSTKRIYSPLANEDPLLSSTFINENDSNSELPTPQPIETAASISRNANVKLGRNLSLKNTMSDIDNALRELEDDSIGPPDRFINSSRDEEHSITHETILSATDGLDVVESNGNPTTGSSTELLNGGLEKQAALINGIDTTKLNPVEAEFWSPEEITAYFIMEGYDVQSASRFQKHKISGKILLELELVHLKELDINSFGTRFEIFKEIEKIKEAIRTNGRSLNRASRTNNANAYNQLMPPANVDQRASYRGHIRKTSQSLEDLPSQQNFTPTSNNTRNSSASKHRPKSLVFDSQEANANITPDVQIPQVVEEMAGSEHLFVSPRRAPKPPSYPSPAQPPKSPLLSNSRTSPSPTQLYSWQSPTLSYPGSKKPSYIDQYSSSNSNSNSRSALFKNNQGSGKALSPIPSPTRNSVTNVANDSKDNQATSTNRNSVVYCEYAPESPSNRKSSYSSNEEEQFQETMNTFERPTSSIYADGSTVASMNNDKSARDEEGKKKPTRHSSLLSSKSKSDSRRNSSVKRSSSASRTSSFRKSSFMLSPFRQQFTDNAPRTSPSPEENAIASTPSEKNSSPLIDKKSSKKSRSKRRSVSAKEAENFTEVVKDDKNKRSASEAVRSEALKGKSLRQMTARPVAKKKQTSAFIEGLRSISVKEAMKDADFSGWMSKKGSGAMSTWKTRFFTLHGTRLSYFSSTTDTRERGLIDITAHRVVPAKEDDKLVSLYAASTGKGRYCFKLLPPQPGSKKGLTFTQPRTHYFAVDNKEEMRGWMAALIKTTIDIDTSVPIISSYTTPTVSLSKAQEMLAEAREETKLREQQMLENEEDEDQFLWDQQQLQQQQHDNNQGQADRTISASTQRTSDEDNTISTPNLSSATNTTLGSNGFSSPFLLASGLLSPGVARNNSVRGPEKKGKFLTEDDYFGDSLKHKADKP
ncbi:Boi2p [Saccharomyces paradoxus]|uniref:Boi2p n=1 Tax=Saccharomyces paradoxus TaxID=27291 RepID=A0A8B8UQ77_SACPA|nr:Boi2 [Saccharomyces paradoxus]QHS72903.1 Boi2 [Saccharomyces paradoxus]